MKLHIGGQVVLPRHIRENPRSGSRTTEDLHMHIVKFREISCCA